MDAPRSEQTSAPPKAKTPKQQLSKGMEHIRCAVTISPSATPSSQSSTPAGESSESDTYGVPAAFEPVRKPAHRSHDPSNNLKRSDPFQFGSRYLEEGDDIFEFNAWDHVETDETYREFSEQQYARQRESPVSDFDKRRFNAEPERFWNAFYANNKAQFFKNRKWLQQEFPLLHTLTAADAAPATILEVGAGAGNTAFPVLAQNKNQRLKIHACDFSKKAVELIRANEAYDTQFIQADVWDVASLELPPGLQEGSVDVVMMIFIFSALAPSQWRQAVWNIWRVLKPGGQVLFRDYGRGDLAQVRFKKGRYMDENFYVRGDGTRVYFFEQQELESIWKGEHFRQADGGEPTKPDVEEVAQRAEQLTLEGDAQTNQPASTTSVAADNEIPAFEVTKFGVDRRMLVNRQRKLKMYRCWMQAVFRKPGAKTDIERNVDRAELEATQDV